MVMMPNSDNENSENISIIPVINLDDPIMPEKDTATKERSEAKPTGFFTNLIAVLINRAIDLNDLKEIALSTGFEQGYDTRLKKLEERERIIAERETKLENDREAFDYTYLAKYISDSFERLNDVRNEITKEANRSFLVAIIASLVGLSVFSYSILYKERDLAILGTAFSGFISAVNFYLYRKSSSELIHIHDTIYDVERLLFANSICDKLVYATSQDNARCKVIDKLSRLEKKPESVKTEEESSSRSTIQ